MAPGAEAAREAPAAGRSDGELFEEARRVLRGLVAPELLDRLTRRDIVSLLAASANEAVAQCEAGAEPEPAPGPDADSFAVLEGAPAEDLAPGAEASADSYRGACERHWEKSEAAGDSIKVCVRVRPLTAQERAAGLPETVSCSAQCTEALQLLPPAGEPAAQVPPGGAAATLRSFDAVLAGGAPQRQVYGLLGDQVVQGIMGGYHGCVFAYGQTGSGKTHTIFGGPGEERGLVPRIAEELFAGLGPGGEDHAVRLSYLELYNERARDLLSPVAHGSPPALEVREHPRVGVFVQGLTKSLVHSAGEVARLLDFGHRVRAVGSTSMNAASSRSHAIVTFHVERAVVASGGGGDPLCSRRRRAQLHAVDLAGSERLWQAGGCEVRQHESRQINKSLLALSTMISRLADRDKGARYLAAAKAYVPYRDSKLTFLLSESLMGSCKTAMLACVSPSAQCFAMTESTLRFAESVKRIRTTPVRNEEPEGDLLRALQAEVGGLRQRLQDAEGAAAGGEQEARQRLAEELEAAKGLTDELSRTRAEERALTARADAERLRALAGLGVAAAEAGAAAGGPPPLDEERARRLARNEERLNQLAEGAQRLLKQARGGGGGAAEPGRGSLQRSGSRPRLQSPARASMPPIW